MISTEEYREKSTEAQDDMREKIGESKSNKVEKRISRKGTLRES